MKGRGRGGESNEKEWDMVCGMWVCQLARKGSVVNVCCRHVLTKIKTKEIYKKHLHIPLSFALSNF